MPRCTSTTPPRSSRSGPCATCTTPCWWPRAGPAGPSRACSTRTTWSGTPSCPCWSSRWPAGSGRRAGRASRRSRAPRRCRPCCSRSASPCTPSSRRSCAGPRRSTTCWRPRSCSPRRSCCCIPRAAPAATPSRWAGSCSPFTPRFPRCPSGSWSSRSTCWPTACRCAAPSPAPCPFSRSASASWRTATWCWARPGRWRRSPARTRARCSTWPTPSSATPVCSSGCRPSTSTTRSCGGGSRGATPCCGRERCSPRRCWRAAWRACSAADGARSAWAARGSSPSCCRCRTSCR